MGIEPEGPDRAGASRTKTRSDVILDSEMRNPSRCSRFHAVHASRRRRRRGNFEVLESFGSEILKKSL